MVLYHYNLWLYCKPMKEQKNNNHSLTALSFFGDLLIQAETEFARSETNFINKLR